MKLIKNKKETLLSDSQNALNAAKLLKANRPEEVGLNNHIEVTIHEINEADEPQAFYKGKWISIDISHGSQILPS